MISLKHIHDDCTLILPTSPVDFPGIAAVKLVNANLLTALCILWLELEHSSR